MTQCNSLHVNLSNSQLNKFKSAIKNEADVVLRLSSNMIGNLNDKTNFPHKLLLSNRHVANFVKLLLNTHRLILNHQKRNYLRRYNQEDFLVDF